MYEYKVKEIAKVVDGDTVDLILDLGFSLFKKERCRVAGSDGRSDVLLPLDVVHVHVVLVNLDIEAVGFHVLHPFAAAAAGRILVHHDLDGVTGGLAASVEPATGEGHDGERDKTDALLAHSSSRRVGTRVVPCRESSPPILAV